MKKLATLLIAAGLVFGVSTGANAIDFKAKGQWIMSFDYGQHGNFTGGNGQTGYNNKEDEFEARQRIRLQLDAVASEALSGTVYFEIGDTTWGGAGKGTEGQGSGGAMGADGVSVEVKRAYIDWMVPDTDLKVRMGIQGIQAPSFVLKRAQSFGDDVAGIALSYQFNEYVGATAFWARPYNDNFSGYNKNSNKSYNKSYMDNIDLGGDKIIKGAFSQTLASRYPESGAGIPVYWNHDTDDPFKNLGLTTSAIEDEHGLKVEGDIDVSTDIGKQVAKLLKENRVSQMSFAYNVEAGAWVDGQKNDDGTFTPGYYELRQLDLFEVSICPIGMNQATEVSAKKALLGLDPDQQPHDEPSTPSTPRLADGIRRLRLLDIQ